MLSELQRKRVWEGWLSAEIRANYFADLSARYHRHQRYGTWCVLFSSSGVLATFVTKLPQEFTWAAPALALMTAGLSLYSLVAQNQKSAIDSADLHFRWNKLASEYEHLWDNMYAEDAGPQLTKLDERGMELSKVATAFPFSEKRILKWQDHVEKHHAAAARAST
jgi:hypothetical protein